VEAAGRADIFCNDKLIEMAYGYGLMEKVTKGKLLS